MSLLVRSHFCHRIWSNTALLGEYAASWPSAIDNGSLVSMTLSYSSSVLKNINLSGHLTRWVDPDLKRRLQHLALWRPLRGCRGGKAARDRLRNAGSMNIHTLTQRRLKHKQSSKRGVDFNNLLPLRRKSVEAESVNSNQALRFAMINTQSVRNKSADLVYCMCD